MKRMGFLTILAVFVIALALQAIPVQATKVISGWTRYYEGIKYATGTDDWPRLQKTFALRISLRNPDIAMAVTPGNGGAPYDTERK